MQFTSEAGAKRGREGWGKELRNLISDISKNYQGSVIGNHNCLSCFAFLNLHFDLEFSVIIFESHDRGGYYNLFRALGLWRFHSGPNKNIAPNMEAAPSSSSTGHQYQKNLHTCQHSGSLILMTESLTLLSQFTDFWQIWSSLLKGRKKTNICRGRWIFQ